MPASPAGFARSHEAKLLHLVAQSYGCRPSALLCIPPEDPRALSLDAAIAVACAQQAPPWVGALFASRDESR